MQVRREGDIWGCGYALAVPLLGLIGLLAAVVVVHRSQPKARSTWAPRSRRIATRNSDTVERFGQKEAKA
jgi:hypothetical protein